jgi:hypothetical protein
MANPTTNYSFAMPTNTDLVKDLPADFEVFGQAVDTQMKTNADAAIAKSLVTTKGDIIAATGASTPARLAVGTNDQVLTADSTAASGVAWKTASSGGMTLLSTTTLSGATVTVSSISQSYTSLYGVIYGVTNATAVGYFALKPLGNNNVATSSVEAGSVWNNSSIWYLDSSITISRTDTTNAWFFNIGNYTSATNYKPVNFSGNFVDSNGTRVSCSGGGAIKETSAITSLTLINTGGNLSTGTLLLYGVK